MRHQHHSRQSQSSRITGESIMSRQSLTNDAAIPLLARCLRASHRGVLKVSPQLPWVQSRPGQKASYSASRLSAYSHAWPRTPRQWAR